MLAIPKGNSSNLLQQNKPMEWNTGLCPSSRAVAKPKWDEWKGDVKDPESSGEVHGGRTATQVFSPFTKTKPQGEQKKPPDDIKVVGQTLEREGVGPNHSSP